MVHPIYQVVSFGIVAEYTLQVRFDDGSQQRIDFSPVLAGEVFGPLRQLSLFNQVRLDLETRTLVWPNGADFDPATLHDWPRFSRELAERAERWRVVGQRAHSSKRPVDEKMLSFLHEDGVRYELSEEANSDAEPDTSDTPSCRPILPSQEVPS
jgi:hypothetical protein